MKVHIGPYKDWVGPYQLSNLLMKVGFSEDTCFKIGEYLSETWVSTLLQYLHSKKKRNIKVKIDYWDTWSLDETLCYIIHPALIAFKKENLGIPFIKNEDIPEEFHKSNEGSFPSATGSYNEEGFSWILDEMIWAFDPEWDNKFGIGMQDYTHEKCTKNEKRKANAQILLGKYLSTIWW